MKKDDRKPGFMETHLPRHKAIEAMRTLIGAEASAASKSFLEYGSAFAETADTTKTRPTNLLDLYVQDLRQLYTDASQRPDHYTPQQHSLLDTLRTGGTVSDEDKNELLLTLQRRTTTADEKARRAAEFERKRKKQREEDEEIILEDGRSLAQTIEDEKNNPTFENQDFGDKIIV